MQDASDKRGYFDIFFYNLFDWEGMERLCVWSCLNIFSLITKEMTPFHYLRKDKYIIFF